MVQRGWQRKCPQCGRPGTMLLEEPEHASIGKQSLWIAATGCWQVLGAKLVHRCKGSMSSSTMA
jgi:hypothetical protein